MLTNLQDVHDYCVLLADVVKNYAHKLRKPDRNTLSDWTAHASKTCPPPASLDQALLDPLGPEHWQDIKAEFPNSTASNIHEFVTKDLAAEMLDAAAKGFDALSGFVRKLERLRLPLRLKAEFKATRDPWHGWKTVKAYASELRVSETVVKDAIRQFKNSGLTDRRGSRGDVNMRESVFLRLKSN